MTVKHASIVALCSLLCIFSASSESHALITGGKGNQPLGDPGWPAGAAQAFNTQYRIAWWEGPPFGGGEWHAECQGNSENLSSFLNDFAKIEGVKKRLMVHDGTGHSFWLDPNGDQAKSRELNVDWTLVIWQKEKWEFQKGLPRDISALASTAEREPTADVHVYTGGAIKWKDVRVPEGIEVIGETLEAHGFQLDDGRVVEGKLVNSQSKKPLTAQVILEKIEALPKGGYAYDAVATTQSDATGHWVMKKLPPGWFRIVARCPGYVPRLLVHLKLDGQPGWQQVNAELAQSASVSGRVMDPAGKAIAGAVVRLGDAVYESPDGYEATSNEQGEFQIAAVPRGAATVRVHRQGYTRPGLGLSITVPCKPLQLEMLLAGSVHVQVRFATPPSGGYIVSLTDARGEAVGRYGGSGNIDAQHEMVFKDVPPGEYMISGQPNPGGQDQRTKQVAVTVVGGKEMKVELQAK